MTPFYYFVTPIIINQGYYRHALGATQRIHQRHLIAAQQLFDIH